MRRQRSPFPGCCDVWATCFLAILEQKVRVGHMAFMEDIVSVRQHIKLHPAAPPADAIIAEELQSPHATNVFRTRRQSSAHSAIDYTPRHVARVLTHYDPGRESALLRALTRHQITTCLKLMIAFTNNVRWTFLWSHAVVHVYRDGQQEDGADRFCIFFYLVMRSNGLADNPRQIITHICNDIPRVFFFVSIHGQCFRDCAFPRRPRSRSCLRGQHTHPRLWRPSTRLERATGTPSATIPDLKRHMGVARERPLLANSCFGQFLLFWPFFFWPMWWVGVWWWVGGGWVGAWLVGGWRHLFLDNRSGRRQCGHLVHQLACDLDEEQAFEKICRSSVGCVERKRVEPRRFLSSVTAATTQRILDMREMLCGVRVCSPRHLDDKVPDLTGDQE